MTGSRHAASNLQPSDLRSNTYRSPPGGQVFSPYFALRNYSSITQIKFIHKI